MLHFGLQQCFVGLIKLAKLLDGLMVKVRNDYLLAEQTGRVCSDRFGEAAVVRTRF